MPNWDQDSPRLRKHLAQILDEIAKGAERREAPTLKWARRWQSLFMRDLAAPDARYVGAFRGEAGLENIQARIGSYYGVTAAKVCDELRHLESTLQKLVSELDALVPCWPATRRRSTCGDY